MAEDILHFWRRHSQMEKSLGPLCSLVRDILGVATSSASVERLFSEAGNVFGHKRGSLSAQALRVQTSVRLWRKQGIDLFTGPPAVDEAEEGESGTEVEP
jgi:hypothetical protein